MNDKELLSSMVSTVQMGQIGIRSVLDPRLPKELHTALQDQLKEYDALETKIQDLAAAQGWQLKEVNPIIRKMSERMAKIRMSYGNVPSKVAGMMIQGNTRGMIMSLKNQHKHNISLPAVASLSNSLLLIEESNIKQMQAFL